MHRGTSISKHSTSRTSTKASGRIMYTFHLPRTGDLCPFTSSSPIDLQTVILETTSSSTGASMYET
ncbi:unnamed protein product [Symbiodinium microadriaticum]|nr:unnamed protein product [Symbiodinium microadriaticum]